MKASIEKLESECALYIAMQTQLVNRPTKGWVTVHSSLSLVVNGLSESSAVGSVGSLLDACCQWSGVRLSASTRSR